MQHKFKHSNSLRDQRKRNKEKKKTKMIEKYTRKYVLCLLELGLRLVGVAVAREKVLLVTLYLFELVILCLHVPGVCPIHCSRMKNKSTANFLSVFPYLNDTNKNKKEEEFVREFNRTSHCCDKLQRFMRQGIERSPLKKTWSAYNRAPGPFIDRIQRKWPYIRILAVSIVSHLEYSIVYITKEIVWADDKKQIDAGNYREKQKNPQPASKITCIWFLFTILFSIPVSAV